MASSQSLPSALGFIADDVSHVLGLIGHFAPPPAPAVAPFSALYVFGDSLSDDGNVSLATLGLVPVSPPYADRSFSNGPVWAQNLAQELGLSLKASLSGGTDFAYGGAHTGQTPVHKANATDLPSQFSQFQTQINSPRAGSLYAIWIGANDVLDIADDTSLSTAEQQADVGLAVNNEISFIRSLIGRGAQNFLVLNVPDLGKTPDEVANGSGAASNASALAALYDSELAAALRPLQTAPGYRVDLVDTFSVLNQVSADPGAYGFTNVTDPVWTGNLTNSGSGTLAATGSAQNQYLFFDSLHPTSQAHLLLALGISGGLLTALAINTPDFNGDGRSDILWQNTDGSIAIWEMSGTSMIGGGAAGAPGASWHAVGSGDFNGDGKSDILWQNDNSSVVIWEMDGTSMTGGGFVLAPGVSWHIGGTGDFNADGKTDIVWQNDNSSVVIWEMSGASIVGAGFVAVPGLSWHVVGNGDFNGDGKSDILFQNDNSSVAIWEMNGTGMTAAGLIGLPGLGWRAEGTGDFNGDGKSDILWQNDNGSIAIWEMRGLGVLGGAVLGDPGPAWHVLGSDDFNGDGKSDILLQNNDGSVAIWEVSGLGVLSGAVVGTMGAGSQAIGRDGMHFIDGTGSATTLNGTLQADEFVLSSFAPGAHVINGFDTARDIVALSSAVFANFAAVQVHSAASGGGTLIDLGGSSSLLLAGVAPGSLHASDFALA